jgi:hypothetical protein
MNRLAPGQSWTYRTRKGEEASRVRVVSTENSGADDGVVHALLVDVRLQTPRGHQDFLYAPMSERVFRASVVDVVGADEDVSRAPEGLAHWRAARRAGRGGVWTIPLAEVLDAMQEAIRRASPPTSQ